MENDDRLPDGCREHRDALGKNALCDAEDIRVFKAEAQRLRPEHPDSARLLDEVVRALERAQHERLSREGEGKADEDDKG